VLLGQLVLFGKLARANEMGVTPDVSQGRGSVVIVVKFGGTSLAGTERMRAAARIVAAHRRDQSVVCVVSAMAGVTDALITTIEHAIRGITAWQITLAEISTRHQTTLDELTTATGTIPTITSRFATITAALEADIQRLLATPFATAEARAHAVAAFSGWGERLAVLLFAQALAAEGVAAVPFEGEPIVMVERRDPAGTGYVRGPRPEQPDAPMARLAPSVAATRRWLTPQLADAQAADMAPVLPGYLGRTWDGEVTTLGRNGSDYSAAVIAAALRAETLYLYGTVAGVHRADPRVVPEADILPALTYVDAAEAAALGARVLHPATLRPLAAAGIPLRLRNTLSPDAPGTDVGPMRLFPATDLEQSGWVVAARGAHSDEASGLVEVTGLCFRHAEWDAHEDDHLDEADEDPSAAAADGVGGRHDGPVSGALALLTAPPLPVRLAWSPRRISVAVPSEESGATQRRLYSALAHADARARRHFSVMPPEERRRTS
jgi:aspartokinase